MARYRGPTCKLARREGMDLFLKSAARGISTKCKLNTRPGQHGLAKGRPSNFSTQLRMKQTVCRYYGVLDKQFRKYFREADRKKGSTGENLLRMLECRLDNVVFRMGLACTRAEARQMVNHGAVKVNGRRVDIPSFLVSPSDVIEVADKAKGQLRIASALAQGRPLPEYIDFDPKAMKGLLKAYPEASDFPPEFTISLVIEFFSKRL